MIDANDYYLNQHLNQEADFQAWIENNEQLILESYIETLDIDSVPDDFLNNLYESCRNEEPDYDKAHDRE